MAEVFAKNLDMKEVINKLNPQL